MKIHAYQRPPEWQESPLFFDDSAFDEIQLFGNRYFQERTTDQYKNIPAMLDDIVEETFYLMQGQKHYTDFSTILEAYTGRDSYTRAERKQWIEILRRWTETDEETRVFIDVLTLLNGKQYNFSTLRGCCQSDWQYIIYPADFGAEWLRSFEVQYFNNGTEWEIREDDETQTFIYCTTDDPRAEISDALGVTPGDIILCEFDGWERTPKYKEVPRT